MTLAVSHPPRPADLAGLWADGIPLSWVRASREVPYANLGDALSALVVGAISGGPVRHAHFDAPIERLIGIGTIVQEQRRGVLHLWGSGIDAKINRANPPLGHYTAPVDTTIIPHAVRGPHTAAALRRAGIATPAVYGDPAWFMPRILPRSLFPAEPTHELGVICHISELDALTPQAGANPRFRRYAMDQAPAGAVRLINTLVEPTLEAITAKMGEILSCRRILSSSFHGLILPMAYGVPSLTFSMHGQGFHEVTASDGAALDHRFGDFFAGVGLGRVPVVGAPRHAPVADWLELSSIVEHRHQPLGWTGRDLFEAFPGPRRVTFDDPVWPIPDAFKTDFLF